MDYKDIIGFAALGLGICGYFPYMRGIWRGWVRPHVFTWCVWALITGIGFAAQVHDGAGPGSWVMGFTAAACLAVALAALKKGETTITRADWAFFISALSAIPLWVLTKNPLWSVILICVIDACAFGPTFRKSWTRPGEEALSVYWFSSIKFAMSLAAMDAYTWVTVLYAGFQVVINSAFALYVLWRRRVAAAPLLP